MQHRAHEKEERPRDHEREQRVHPPRRVQRIGNVGAEHEELTVGDVEHAHQAVLEIEAQRDQRVDAADDQATERHVEEEREVHPRYALSTRASRATDAGSPSQITSPWWITITRSAVATFSRTDVSRNGRGVWKVRPTPRRQI